MAYFLELSRVFRRDVSGRAAAAGTAARRLAILAVFIQTIYLAARVVSSISHRGMPLSNWSDWCNVAAWLLALLFILLANKRPAFGVFLLPLILTLIGISLLMPTEAVFQKAQSARALGMVHGIALLLGTVTVLFGFSAGVMYLWQASRLKHKTMTSRIRLPSLEYLQRANERALVGSAVFLMVGILAGFALNVAVARRAGSSVPLDDPTVLISAALGVWLFAAWVFSAIYRPVKNSKKVAYLTVASFVAFALTMAIVLFGPSTHARDQASAAVRRTRHLPGVALVSRKVKRVAAQHGPLAEHRAWWSMQTWREHNAPAGRL